MASWLILGSYILFHFFNQDFIIITRMTIVLHRVFNLSRKMMNTSERSSLMVLNSNNICVITSHFEAANNSLGDVIIELNSRAFVNILEKKEYISCKAKSSKEKEGGEHFGRSS